MKSLDKSVASAHQILKKKGKLIMLVFDEYVKDHFICNKLSKKGILSNTFKKLDNGRYDEISRYSKACSLNTLPILQVFLDLRQVSVSLSLICIF